MGVSAGFADGVVERALELRGEELPAAVTAMAADAILDTVGVALAGLGEPVVTALGRVLGADCGEASGFGRPGAVASQDAALFNATAAHALDYDDALPAFGGHPTAPVLPAALALAESLGCRGEELLRAVVVGIEVESQFGEWIGEQTYEKGWHTTSSLGVFGAAAACALLLGLERDGLRQALGLAAIQSAGLRGAFGTMGKPLQVGFAARAGLQAAQLADAGATGPWASLADGSFARQVAGEVENRPCDGEVWRLLGNVFKYHACCYFTHSSLQALESLRAGGDELGEKVSAVELEVSPTAAAICDRPDFDNGLDSKFSLQAAAARVVLDIDTADPTSFSDEAAAEPALREAAGRVQVVVDEAVPKFFARATVLTGGERLVAEATTGSPEPDPVRQRERLVRKFQRLAEPVVGGSRSEALRERLLDLEGTEDMRDLGELLRAGGRS